MVEDGHASEVTRGQIWKYFNIIYQGKVYHRYGAPRVGYVRTHHTLMTNIVDRKYTYSEPVVAGKKSSKMNLLKPQSAFEFLFSRIVLRNM